MGILRYTQFECRPKHISVLNDTMLYLVPLMMTGSEILKNLEDDQIKLWPEHKSMVLDITIIMN